MTTNDKFPTLNLTEREIEILELLNEGLKNKEIAERTKLTLYTVKWYLKQIYGKLYVSNRTQAAAKARELGLLTEGGRKTTSSMTAVRGNLPEATIPFLGRQDELQMIKQLLVNDEVRLVTLHGIGGIGKTRLALEVGQQVLPSFDEGVYFISLEATDTNPLLSLAETFTLNISGDDIAQQLSIYLHKKHILILFDNFEHLHPYANEIATLLEHTQHLRLLVTSREVLNLRSERVVTLQGLESDEGGAAYQLYMQRAQFAVTNFNPDINERAYIHKICQLVNGLPLAIEMAAGWVSVMTVENTYRQIQHNIDLLIIDERDRPKRHKSIRATFDYSLNSLSDKLREAIIKLGIFHTEGFSVEGAGAVAGLSPLDLRRLIQVALIQRDANGRFNFHPLIRQYISELLKSDTALKAEAEETHGSYYYDFSRRLVKKLYMPDFTLGVIDEFREEGGNLLLAWYYAVHKGYYDWLLLATEVGYITEMAGSWGLSRKMFYDTLRVVPESETILRGRLLALLSIFEGRLYNLERLKSAAWESWLLLKDSQYIWDGRSAMIYLAVLKTIMEDSGAELDILDEIDSVHIPLELQPNAYVYSLNQIGRPLTLLYAGKLEEALPLLEEANIPSWAESIIYLPECYFLLGMKDKALQLLIRLFTTSLDNKNHRLAQMTTYYLALIENGEDDIPSGLTNNLIELTRLGFKYEFIARNSYYYGVTLMMRGLRQQAYYSWYGGLNLLDFLGELALKYQYVNQIASHLTNFEPNTAVELFEVIVHTKDCPDSLRKEALNHIISSQLIIDTSLTVNQVLLNRIKELSSN